MSGCLRQNEVLKILKEVQELLQIIEWKPSIFSPEANVYTLFISLYMCHFITIVTNSKEFMKKVKPQFDQNQTLTP